MLGKGKPHEMFKLFSNHLKPFILSKNLQFMFKSNLNKIELQKKIILENPNFSRFLSGQLPQFPIQAKNERLCGFDPEHALE